MEMTGTHNARRFRNEHAHLNEVVRKEAEWVTCKVHVHYLPRKLVEVKDHLICIWKDTAEARDGTRRLSNPYLVRSGG